jgi:hypothetical protein
LKHFKHCWGIALIIFMAGNLLEVGLKVKLGEVARALHDGRFLGLSVLWSFVLCPALAYLLTKVIPMAEPYALGLCSWAWHRVRRSCPLWHTGQEGIWLTWRLSCCSRRWERWCTCRSRCRCW